MDVFDDLNLDCFEIVWVPNKILLPSLLFNHQTSVIDHICNQNSANILFLKFITFFLMCFLY